MSILVFDIETVPDLLGARRLNDLDGLDDDQSLAAIQALRRDKVGHDFLPHYLQQIVAISLVLNQNEQLRVWSLGDESSSEKELITRFYHGIDIYTPTLVSWNGSGFDLPVLHYRALLHGISAPRYWEHGSKDKDFRYNNYLSRYHYRHLDLMDILASYQAKAYAPLDDIACLLGFPGKMGMHGSKVWDYYSKNDLKSIRNYCETDVLNTYCVFLRFELMRGDRDLAGYRQALETLKAYLLQDPSKQHFQDFLSQMKDPLIA